MTSGEQPGLTSSPIFLHKNRMSSQRECAVFILISGLMLGPSRTIKSETVTVKLGAPEPRPAKHYEFCCDLLVATVFQGITFRGIEIEQGVIELQPHGLRSPAARLPIITCGGRIPFPRNPTTWEVRVPRFQDHPV